MVWEPKTQAIALAPILWLNWASGLGVYEIAGLPRFAFSIIYDCIFITVYILFLFHGSNITLNWTQYESISYKLVLAANILMAVVSIVLGNANAKRLKAIIARCEEIDNTLEPFGVKKDYGKTLRGVIMALLLWFGTLAIVTIAHIMLALSRTDIKDFLYLFALVHFPMWLNTALLITFCIFMRLLTEKLRKMNVFMSDMIELAEYVTVERNTQTCQVGKVTVAMNYSDWKFITQHFIQVSMHIHLELVRISKELNRAYCYQLLLALVTELMMLIVSIYILYFVIITSETIVAVLQNHLTYDVLLWIFVHVLKIVIMNYCCSRLSHQARVTKLLLRKVESVFLDDAIRDEVQQFSLQLVLHPLCFSAGGFVHLNNKLTTSFLGTVGTYVAILLQMSSSPSAMHSLMQPLND